MLEICSKCDVIQNFVEGYLINICMLLIRAEYARVETRVIALAPHIRFSSDVGFRVLVGSQRNPMLNKELEVH